MTKKILWDTLVGTIPELLDFLNIGLIVQFKPFEANSVGSKSFLQTLHFHGFQQRDGRWLDLTKSRVNLKISKPIILIILSLTWALFDPENIPFGSFRHKIGARLKKTHIVC